MAKKATYEPKIGDRVNAIGCREAGEPDVTNMKVVSEPWALGHGEIVVRVERPSGKRDTRAVRQLTPA
jgi:hypothetical protein